MFERFTERARQVVVLAQDEARQHHHAHIGLPHLAVGLMREEEGLAAKVLTSLGITAEDISYEGIPTLLGNDKDRRPEMSAAGKRVCELALREALTLGHNYIGTEHLLLGYLTASAGQEGDPLVSRSEEIRWELMRALCSPKAKPKSKPSEPPKPSLETQLLRIAKTALLDALNAITDAVQQA